MTENKAHAAGGEPVVDPAADRQPGELLELVVGTEEVDVDAGDHLGDREVGDRGEKPFGRPRETRHSNEELETAAG